MRRWRSGTVFSDILIVVHRRVRLGLILFGFANAVGLLEFWYRYLDVLTRERHESPWIKIIEELTGAYSAFAVVPVIIWMTRRFPLGPGTSIRTRIPESVCSRAGVDRRRDSGNLGDVGLPRIAVPAVRSGPL